MRTLRLFMKVTPCLRIKSKWCIVSKQHPKTTPAANRHRICLRHTSAPHASQTSLLRASVSQRGEQLASNVGGRHRAAAAEHDQAAICPVHLHVTKERQGPTWRGAQPFPGGARASPHVARPPGMVWEPALVSSLTNTTAASHQPPALGPIAKGRPPPARPRPHHPDAMGARRPRGGLAGGSPRRRWRPRGAWRAEGGRRWRIGPDRRRGGAGRGGGGALWRVHILKGAAARARKGTPCTC